MGVAPPGAAAAGTIDFFAAQEAARARARSRFALVLLCIPLVVLAIDFWVGLIVGVITLERLPVDQWLRVYRGEPWLLFVIVPSWIYAVATAVSLFVMFKAMYGRSRELAFGAAAFAQGLGARAVDRDKPFPQERALVNIADEMALAAQLPPPALYVIDAEREAINALAFAAGADDTAVILTQGAVLQLPRAELQALVAYALARVCNGDVRLNVRVIGWLAALTAVSAFGKAVMRLPFDVARRVPADDDGKGGAALPVFVIGSFMCLPVGGLIVTVGALGYSFARWIRALGARQRVLLADATALQFTREPAALTALLQRLAQAGRQRLRYGEEAELLLFLPAAGWRCISAHPSIARRLGALRDQPGP